MSGRTAGSALFQGKYVAGKKGIVGDPRLELEERSFRGAIQRPGQEPLFVIAVAGGAGKTGAHAAELGLSAALRFLRDSQGEDAPSLIERALQRANSIIYEENQAAGIDGYASLALAVLLRERLYIGRAGDCSVYWVQASGSLISLTDESPACGTPLGRNPFIDPDLAFHVAGKNPDRALQMGRAGLPLKPSESIVISTAPLTDARGGGPVTALEILEALNAEVEADRAAVKIVGYAEGRRIDRNITVATLQCLTSQQVALHEGGRARSARLRLLRWSVVTAASLMLISLAAYLLVSLVRVDRANQALLSVTPFVILPTPVPPTPTMQLDPGTARVEDVIGGVATVRQGQMLENGDQLFTGDGGLRIVVGEADGSDGILFIFRETSLRLWFGEKLAPELNRGALFIHPGSGYAEVRFPGWGGTYASVTGSRMIVERSDNQIKLYCFEGICRLELSDGGIRRLEAGYSLSYDALSGWWTEPKLMDSATRQNWNQRCGRCMADLVPEPTSMPEAPEPPKGNPLGPAASGDSTPVPMEPLPAVTTEAPISPPAPICTKKNCPGK